MVNALPFYSSTWQSGTKGKWHVSSWLAIKKTKQNRKTPKKAIIILHRCSCSFSKVTTVYINNRMQLSEKQLQTYKAYPVLSTSWPRVHRAICWWNTSKLIMAKFTVHHSSLHGVIMNKQNNQLPVGLLAQLVEHCTSITEVKGFFIFTTASVVFT